MVKSCITYYGDPVSVGKRIIAYSSEWAAYYRLKIFFFLAFLPLLDSGQRRGGQETRGGKDAYEMRQRSLAGTEPGMLQLCGMHNDHSATRALQHKIV